MKKIFIIIAILIIVLGIGYSAKSVFDNGLFKFHSVDSFIDSLNDLGYENIYYEDVPEYSFTMADRVYIDFGNDESVSVYVFNNVSDRKEESKNWSDPYTFKSEYSISGFDYMYPAYFFDYKNIRILYSGINEELLDDIKEIVRK